MLKLIQSDILQADLNDMPPINLVVTSPPYNVGIEYDEHKDTLTYAKYLVWCKQWLQKMFDHMPDDGRLCVNIPFTINPEHINKTKSADNVDNHIHYPVVADYTTICQQVGFKYWRTVIWDKPISMKTCWGSWRSASAPFMRDPSEALLVFYKKQWKRLNKGKSTISGAEFMSWTKSIWKMQPETKSKHPAAFPPELPKRCIKVFSYEGDTVMDCFMGSGTTGEVAVQLDRNFVGIEKSQAYFDMAKERIEQAQALTQISKQIMPVVPVDHADAEAW